MSRSLVGRAGVQETLAGVRFLLDLPMILRHPITEDEARTILRQRIVHRESSFLALAGRAIYPYPDRPYRRLLDAAGCELGDLEALVRRDGLEGALGVLYRKGVYLTIEEYKGRQAVVRGSTTFQMAPFQLHNPLVRGRLFVHTSGSSGTETPVPLDVASERDRAIGQCLALAARNGVGWTHALWEVPGGSGLGELLAYAGFGAPPARWFSQVDPATQGLHPRYAWSGRLVRWRSVLAGVPLPRPEHCPVDDPLPIAHWMQEVLRGGRVPHLHTFASAGAKLAAAAMAAGVDIAGGQLTLSGEPVTAARMATIARSGAHAVPKYGASEIPMIAQGCLAPIASDDLHICHDLHAVIQPGPAGFGGAVPPNALLLSSLQLSTKFVLLNWSPGDQAIVEERACGCPVEAMGRHTHLHSVRSFEKLTAGGMTFLDADIIRVLEEILPARFGGGPIDYQLAEEEGPSGDPRLRLIVSPAVGALDEEAVVDAFLEAIGPGVGAERVMGLMWRSARFVRVERRLPIVSGSGKILHLVRALAHPGGGG